MSSAIVEQTVQGALLSATSNLIAQAITAYQTQKPFALDIAALAKYVAYGVLNTPPNVIWQHFLEDTFPSTKPAKGAQGREKDGGERVSTGATNLIAKFVLDQTFGALFNVLLFIVATSAMDGAGLDGVVGAVKQDFFEIYRSGLALWPLVSLFSFIAVPVRQRVLFGSIAGVMWGVYLSLVSLRS